MLTTSFIFKRFRERERERERELWEWGGIDNRNTGYCAENDLYHWEIYVNEIVIFCVNYFYAYYISGRNSARCNPAFDRTFDIWCTIVDSTLCADEMMQWKKFQEIWEMRKISVTDHVNIRHCLNVYPWHYQTLTNYGTWDL